MCPNSPHGVCVDRDEAANPLRPVVETTPKRAPLQTPTPGTALADSSAPKVESVLSDRMSGTERQRQTLIESLRVRFAKAVADNDADAKAALFKEAVYLGIQPDAFTGSDLDQTA